MANQNPAIAEAAKTMHAVMDDSRIQYIYEARLAGERTWLSYEHDVQKAQQKLTEAHAELTETQAELTETQAELTETQAELAETRSDLTKAQAEIERLKALLNQ